MTGQERDYDEVLSRVLHSTTDHIEPVGDGLTKIQARLAEPWLKRQWWLLRNEFTTLGWVLAVRCQSWFSTLRSGWFSTLRSGWFSTLRSGWFSMLRSGWFSTLRSGSAAGADAGNVTAGAGAAGDGGQLRSLQVLGSLGTRASTKRRRNAGAPLRDSAVPAVAWLRPALAVTGAVVLVVAAVLAVGKIQTVAGLMGDNSHGTSGSNQSGGPGNTNGSGGLVSPGSSATQGNGTSPSPGSSPSGKVSPSPTACSSPSPPSASASASPPPSSPSASPSSSPTPSPTPSPSASPTTSTPTPTTTQAPLANDTPPASAQTQVIRTTALVCYHTPSPPASPANQPPSGP